jgi:hypothetical protein
MDWAFFRVELPAPHAKLPTGDKHHSLRRRFYDVCPATDDISQGSLLPRPLHSAGPGTQRLARWMDPRRTKHCQRVAASARARKPSSERWSEDPERQAPYRLVSRKGPRTWAQHRRSPHGAHETRACDHRFPHITRLTEGCSSGWLPRHESGPLVGFDIRAPVLDPACQLEIGRTPTLGSLIRQGPA